MDGGLEVVCIPCLTCAPGRIRTCDTGFRRAVLYPLSYEGVTRSELTERWTSNPQRSSAITFENDSACGACTMM
jgi:hypothetical protein